MATLQSRVQVVTESTPVFSQALGDDEALLQIGAQKFVMDYDALYELAFRMAHLLSQMAEAEGARGARQ